MWAAIWRFFKLQSQWACLSLQTLPSELRTTVVAALATLLTWSRVSRPASVKLPGLRPQGGQVLFGVVLAGIVAALFATAFASWQTRQGAVRFVPADSVSFLVIPKL